MAPATGSAEPRASGKPFGAGLAGGPTPSPRGGGGVGNQAESVTSSARLSSLKKTQESVGEPSAAHRTVVGATLLHPPAYPRHWESGHRRGTNPQWRLTAWAP